ncbi:unnamed protein product [Discosporangium mesarthrocarpum]
MQSTLGREGIPYPQELDDVASICSLVSRHPHPLRSGVTKLYEARLKEVNPNRGHIQYDISDLFGFIDSLTDLCVLVFDGTTKSYLPHGKDWIKEASFSYLQNLATTSK